MGIWMLPTTPTTERKRAHCAHIYAYSMLNTVSAPIPLCDIVEWLAQLLFSRIKRIRFGVRAASRPQHHIGDPCVRFRAETKRANKHARTHTHTHIRFTAKIARANRREPRLTPITSSNKDRLAGPGAPMDIGACGQTHWHEIQKKATYSSTYISQC